MKNKQIQLNLKIEPRRNKPIGKNRADLRKLGELLKIQIDQENLRKIKYTH